MAVVYKVFVTVLTQTLTLFNDTSTLHWEFKVSLPATGLLFVMTQIYFTEGSMSVHLSRIKDSNVPRGKLEERQNTTLVTNFTSQYS